MYVTGLDCSWMDSPFWRQRFLLDSQADLVLLLNSGIGHVTIDTSKGLGPALDRAAPGPVDLPADVVVERRAHRRPGAMLRNEFDRAREVLERSKTAVTAMFGQARLGKVVELSTVAPLVEEIAASMLRDRSAMLNVTRLKTKDEYTYLHSVAVCALMINLGRRAGLDEAEVQELGIAGLLHDIGKTGVPDSVLAKPGRLDADETEIVRSHPEKGHVLLSQSRDMHPITLDVCLHHHEKFDGSGYPFGLSGSQLSIHARIAAICDVYDAVTSERPYKSGWSANEALARMLEWQGHFDPELLKAFIDSIGIQPRDGLVRTFSNRLGLVVGEGDNPAAPPVRVFYDIASDRFIEPELVETRNEANCDPIIGGERWAYWFGNEWQSVQAAAKSGEIPGAGLAPKLQAVAR